MPVYRFHLRFDEEASRKLGAYYLYRSEQQYEAQPVMDGVRIHRRAIDGDPPDLVEVCLNW